MTILLKVLQSNSKPPQKIILLILKILNLITVGHLTNFNIGNSNPTPLMHFINCLEKKLGKKAIKQYLPIQLGDVPSTESDNKSLEKLIDFKPSTSVKVAYQNLLTGIKISINIKEILKILMNFFLIKKYANKKS